MPYPYDQASTYARLGGLGFVLIGAFLGPLFDLASSRFWDSALKGALVGFVLWLILITLLMPAMIEAR